MSKRSIWRWVAISALVVGGVRVGVARAQSAPTPAPQASGNVSGTRQVQLTPSQQLAQSEALVPRIRTVRTGVSRMLDNAQRQGDIIKTNCLNDKLTQIDAAVRSVTEHLDLLRTAVSVNNTIQSNHEYTLINTFRQRVQNLQVEANQCVGEDAAGFGEAVDLSVQVNPNIPQEDLDLIPGGTIETYIPPTLSPVR